MDRGCSRWRCSWPCWRTVPDNVERSWLPDAPRRSRSWCWERRAIGHYSLKPNHDLMLNSVEQTKILLNYRCQRWTIADLATWKSGYVRISRIWHYNWSLYWPIGLGVNTLPKFIKTSSASIQRYGIWYSLLLPIEKFGQTNTPRRGSLLWGWSNASQMLLVHTASSCFEPPIYGRRPQNSFKFLESQC